MSSGCDDLQSEMGPQQALDPAELHRPGDVIAFVNQSMQQQTIQSAGGKDFNYPVEVADGRRLTISWNRGENPQVGVSLGNAPGHLFCNGFFFEGNLEAKKTVVIQCNTCM